MKTMSQTNYKTPKILEPIEGKVPNCPNCNVLFAEPVSANEDYKCPACKQPFNVIIRPEEQSEEKPKE
jgi:phage FluMu protein Com